MSAAPRHPGGTRGHRERYRTALAWGFADQGFSSATNFGLSLLAGRMLGPAGLGTVFLGFTVYLLTSGFQRHLLIEPLVAASSGRDEDHRRATASFGLTLAMAGAAALSLVVLGAGLLVAGPIGDGFVLISPWLAPALVQDYWRHLLFRDGRAPRAAVNDGAWLLAMALATPAAVLLGTPWAAMGAWGVGALTGAIIGFLQTGVRPGAPQTALRWWSKEGWPFGRWNVGAGLVMNVTSQGTAFVISFLVGASALGGLRAAESIFAPLTLIVPAIALPGLPAITSAYAKDPARGRDLAFRLSALALVGAAVYILMMILGGWRLLPLLFGAEFLRYRDLIWPLAAGQMFLAVGIGFLLLIKAQKRGRVLFFNRVVAGVVALAMVTIFAALYGIVGAAWGSAAGSLTSTIVLAYAALRGRGSIHRTDEHLEPASG